MTDMSSSNDKSDQYEDQFSKKFIGFYLVVIILFLVMFTMRGTITVLQVYGPVINDALLLQEGQISIIFTIYGMTAAITSLFIGPITDRLGYKVIIAAGMLFFAGGTILSSFGNVFWLIKVAQALVGFGAALFGPAVIAFAGEYFPQEKISTIIGVIMSSFYVATIVAVPLVVYAASYLDWHWGVRLIGLVGALVFILTLFGLPKTRKKRKSQESNGIEKKNEIKDYFSRFKIVLKDKYAIGTFFTTFFQRGGIFAITVLLSFWVSEEFGYNEMQKALILMGSGIAAIISNTLFSYIADKTNKRIIILVGTGLTGISFLILPFIAKTGILFIVGFIIANFFGGMPMGSYNAYITEILPDSKGTVVSINNSFGQFSQAIAVAIIVRIIYVQTQNYIWCGIAAFILYAISVILMIFFVKKKNNQVTTS